MFNRDVMAQCKKCGNKAAAKDFIIDYVYKMAVCPTCNKERIQKGKHTPKPEPTQPRVPVSSKPAGWDADDEFLEKAYKKKSTTPASGTVERISDEKLKINCHKCGYKFIYNAFKKQPTSCPYCATSVQRLGVR